MRDTLALALVRAEFCRAYAAERSRPKGRTGDTSDAGASALMARVWRSLRALRRALSTHPPSD